MLMKTLFRRRRSLLAGSALAVMLTVGLVAVAPEFSSPANAQTGPSCADPVTSAPTGPATVSAALTPYGKVLVVGSGAYAGCSLYLLTSDQLHSLTGAPFACSDNANALGAPCDSVLWPPVLTSGRPEAGPGVDQHALGIIVRPDGTHQVTYHGKPLYLFYGDAYITGLPYGSARIDGAGLATPWGVFNTIPP